MTAVSVALALAALLGSFWLSADAPETREQRAMMLEARIVQRFRGFALDVAFETAGPVLGVFGASASGKTTLLHALAGLLRPQEARIAVRGRELCVRPGGAWVRPSTGASRS